MPIDQPTTSSPIIFLVTGDPMPSPADHAAATMAAPAQTRAVRLNPTARGGPMQRLEAQPGRDMVLLTVAAGQGQGPDLRLRLHPEHARALFQAQAGALTRAAGVESGAVLVPAGAQWPDGPPGARRGVAGDLVFKLIELVGLDPQEELARSTAQVLGKMLDQRVTEGVYQLHRQRPGRLNTSQKMEQLSSQEPSPEPSLVLIHGVFVDTDTTFGDLWHSHPALVAQLFAHYKDRVYALDHSTVMCSPIANALTLAASLPQGARLHLLTHSRGGLVAEALLRASQGVSAADLELFKGDDYTRHLDDLQKLGKLLADKQVRIERIVRVACPAYGSLLASNRLDAYLSVLSWLLERANWPVVPELIDFIDAVARQRADPRLFSGVEALRSDSAVVRWLNRDGAPAPGILRVVAGDIEGDSLVSWVKTLLADSYYWADNDLAVQTSSMYGGMLRDGEASFMLERNGKTDHFSYFKNDRSANGVVQALMRDRPDGFAPIGPLSHMGKEATGARGWTVRGDGLGDGSRPAVILLPGIVGSNLKNGDRREWFVWWRLFGMIDRIDMAQKYVTENGPLESYYGDLVQHLDASHDVLPFGFDWRLSLTGSAAKLADLVLLALERRKQSGQPVRLLAHSMGGMVARVMLLEHPEVWQAMMAHTDARVVMLGTPNGGSWAPMSIYTGDDRFGRFLSTVGGAFHEQAARQKMAEFPGLLELQAGLADRTQHLDDAKQWKDMGDRDYDAACKLRPWHDDIEQVAAYRWALPSQKNLDAAVKLRRRLDAQLPDLLSNAAKMAIVLGQAPATPCGVTWGATGMGYLNTAGGDGRVTWDSARLPGVATWKTGHAHGDLPKVQANFAAYTELLITGRTTRLSADDTTSRDVAAQPHPGLAMPRLRDMAPPNGGGPLDPDNLLAAAIGGTGNAPFPFDAFAPQPQRPVLTIEVVHGDLKFTREALLLGHQRSLELTGSEHIVDQLMGNALQDALDLGLYPEQLGQYQIFFNRQTNAANPFAFPRPLAAIVVGLGNEGELQSNGLADAVRQAVLAYLRVAPAPLDAQPGITLNSTTLGSGGNLSVSQSALALVHGVIDANARLAQAPARVTWLPVMRLQIVELFHNRAVEAWHTLRLAIEAGAMSAVLVPQVRANNGRRSLPVGGHYRGAGYDLVRVSQKSVATRSGHDALEFSLYTRLARSELHGKDTQRALVAAMIATAGRNTRYDADLARSLFQLLVPQEIKTTLGTSDTLLLEVDSSTAGYPWEMLDDSDGAESLARPPFALRLSGALIRKMRVDRFRRQPIAAATGAVLVIGSPKLDTVPPLPDLPGARAEAMAVAALFKTVPLLDEDFLSIIKPALAHPWKIIHMAGHGQYDPRGERSGMLMSGGLLFSPIEFESMRTVPELVFVNCCHLGKTEAESPRHHALFAANVAEQLIRNGVRCVVAAGWAVDDAAAQAFAMGFYETLLDDATFAEAVHNGRQRAYNKNPGSNTWAAYQCYGDPAWTLRRNGSQDQPEARASKPPVLATAEELLIMLEAILCDAQGANDAVRRRLQEDLEKLENVASPEWKASGRVAEAFGLAWRDLGDSSKAISWFDKAVLAADGSASLVAREQQLNLLVRRESKVEALRGLIVKIEALIALAPTAERHSILGSAYKRIVIEMDKPGNPPSPAKDPAGDLAQMMTAYVQAEALKPSNLFYPLMQRCLAQLRLHWLQIPAHQQAAPSMADMSDLRRSLAQKEACDPDFWCVIGQHEASLLEGLIEGQLARRMEGIVQGLHDVHGRVSNKNFWSSVHDTAQFYLPVYMRQALPGEIAAADAYLKLVKSFI